MTNAILLGLTFLLSFHITHSSNSTSNGTIVETAPPSKNQTASLPEDDSSCVCPVPDSNGTAMNDSGVDVLEQNAIKMHDELRNKSHFFSRVHHRATHSQNALWASMVVSFLLGLIIVGVLSTQMWKDKSHLAVMNSQPIKYQHYNRKQEILVKDMLKSRAKSFVRLFTGRHRGKRKSSPHPTESLQMETFIRGSDELDSAGAASTSASTSRSSSASGIHQRLLESSSSEDIEDLFDMQESSANDDINDNDSDEEYVFAINRRTGEWIGESEKRKQRHDRKSRSRVKNRNGKSSNKSFFASLFGTKAKHVKHSVNFEFEKEELLRKSSTSSNEEFEHFRIG